MSRSWLIAAVIALAALAWIGSGLVSRDDRADASSTALNPQASATGQLGQQVPARPEAPEGPVRAVRVLTSEERTFANALTLQGRTMANRVVEVRARVAGEILDLPVSRGDWLEIGAPIARLEVADREARVSEAEALVAQRQVEFNATQRLNAQGHRSNTELAAAQAALDAANAQLRMAMVALDRTEIRAPFTGFVDRLVAEQGDYVREGDGIVQLVDPNPLRVEVQVSERYLNQISIGGHATARLLDGRELEGEVVFVGMTASATTRTFPVEIRFDNPNGEIIAGITASVRLPLADAHGHLLPASILALDEQGDLGILIVDQGDRARFQPVRVLGEIHTGGLWLGGLPETARVIVVGQGFVTDGARVRPVEVSREEIRRLAGDSF